MKTPFFIMDLTTKMDVLDMVITCLQEHEKTVDNLIDRLEKAVRVIERRACD